MPFKKSQSTADNLSEGSNNSNKDRSPIIKKEFSSPRLRLQEWEKIDDFIEEFDLFQFENVEELARIEQNKYQGLEGFAKIIEKDEKKKLFFQNSIKPQIKPAFISKKESFNQIFPEKKFYRSHSKEYEEEKKEGQIKKISRISSETALPICETLNFLDIMIKNTSMTQIQESKFKVLKMKISSQNMLELVNIKKEIKKFGPWGEIWEEKEQFIRQNSPYGHFLSYKLRPIIVKGGDDLRQEVLAMQLIRKLKDIFINEKVMVYLRPYEVIVTSSNSGIIGLFFLKFLTVFINLWEFFIEFIPNTMSVDHLKKYFLQKKQETHLMDIYLDIFGVHFEEAQKNFVESLAAYSIICYLLNVKDRFLLIIY